MAININRIQQTGNLWAPTIYTYSFPTIDFNFLNTGSADASLYKFILCVLKAEIDLTPVLNFKLEISEGNLEVYATNNGWGIAYDCEIEINEPHLKRLFTDLDLNYKGQIASGESTRVFSFSKNKSNSDLFGAMKKDFVDVFHYSPISYKHQMIKGINLEVIDISWKSRDFKGYVVRDQEKMRPDDKDGDFIISESGFVKTNNPRSGGGAYSDVTFSTLIDPQKGAFEYEYPFRRVIPSGKTERFHIMIGSPTSCFLRVKFTFLIGGQPQPIESQEFEVEIWNPRNSNWQYPYRDGEQLARDIQEQQAQIARYVNEADKEQAIIGLKQLQDLTSVYPFLQEKNI